MSERRTEILRDADVHHVICPECNGHGSILSPDLSPSFGVGVRPKEQVVDGQYAEVCSRCRGKGWIHLAFGQNSLGGE
jgi:RecJ-like exonuclease